MVETIITVENLSKRYLIGHKAVGDGRYATLRDVIAREARRFARKARDFARGREIVQGDDIEEFWALKEVNFDVRRGEVLGIIGRNGAGKSTLLKILSRITEPTAGRVRIRGRVASLLELGTGFHPELSGRENIYLNGAVLGMTHKEVRRKLDEIVGFAELEKFIDTPVKRFSSGMYVRLAFSVAAHLEADILIIDEVLAAGDLDFQRKCLGKVKAVAGHGRTVLFVSHNMAAITSLTRRSIVLHQGRVVLIGSSAEAVNAYSAINTTNVKSTRNPPWGCGRHTSIRAARLLDDIGLPTTYYRPGAPLKIELEVETDGSRSISCEIMVRNQMKTKVGLASLAHFEGSTLPTIKGLYRVIMCLAPLHLAAGQYTIDLTTSVINQNWDHYVEAAIFFEVSFSNPAGLPFNFSQSDDYGAVALPLGKPTTIELIDAPAPAPTRMMTASI
jgi:lipopolysaccharide transport system ATP-binding protein